ncbi:MAG: hypothetical protein LW850_15540 [Planctomycetaceae bacterium]|jgi:hypothetical protein|nr:hypothetical protein [Planctomycetaceae bacterium]MCE2811797.1 hypothetical protein [Planctomycetaceae bacterium]
MNWETLWIDHAKLLHLAVTWYLVGLIWVIQRVAYPAMEFVDPQPDRAVEAEKRHCDRIFLVVGPMMLFEGLLAGWLMLAGIKSGAWFLPAMGLFLLVIIWGSTAFIQMPMHDQLVKGPDPRLQRRLVQSNWIRTVAWTLRGIVAFILAIQR